MGPHGQRIKSRKRMNKLPEISVAEWMQAEETMRKSAVQPRPVGSITADWERMFEWKRIEREDEPRRISLETMVRGTCEPARLFSALLHPD